VADRVEISCVNKWDRQNEHERIQNVGGANLNGARWKLSEDEAIQGIDSGRWAFFVRYPVEVDVVVAQHGERKYLRTDPDKTKENNLLRLPECL
jgi:hypothetical protein